MDPISAARNLAAKAWRRGSAWPKRSIRAARRGRRLREQFDAFREEWGIERELAKLAQGRDPIIAGPWLSEVGFEVLYWIPFLRWFEDKYRIDPERVIAVSRGGVGAWYREVAGRYVDIFDHVDPDTFTSRNAERRATGESGGQKQTKSGAFDDEVLAATRRALNIGEAAVCHPAFMYRLFNPFWFGNRALDLVCRTRGTYRSPWHGLQGWHRLQGSTALGLALPERYVAAKFYTGAALPDTPAHRHALRELVGIVSRRLPVVLLDTGMATDEHEDYLFRDIPNVVSIREHLTPGTNLGVQTAVVAGAQGFIGTCGSLAWLAPMLGVDTVAVYADDRFLLSHHLRRGARLSPGWRRTLRHARPERRHAARLRDASGDVGTSPASRSVSSASSLLMTRWWIRRRMAIVAAAAVIAAALRPFLFRFNALGGTLGGFDNDHFIHLIRTDMLLQGQQPLRDFADAELRGAWPALTYSMSAWAQQIGGRTLLSEAYLTVGAADAGVHDRLSPGARSVETLVRCASGDSSRHRDRCRRFTTTQKVLVLTLARLGPTCGCLEADRVAAGWGSRSPPRSPHCSDMTTACTSPWACVVGLAARGVGRCAVGRAEHRHVRRTHRGMAAAVGNLGPDVWGHRALPEELR